MFKYILNEHFWLTYHNANFRLDKYFLPLYSYSQLKQITIRTFSVRPFVNKTNKLKCNEYYVQNEQQNNIKYRVWLNPSKCSRGKYCTAYWSHESVGCFIDLDTWKSAFNRNDAQFLSINWIIYTNDKWTLRWLSSYR